MDYKENPFYLLGVLPECGKEEIIDCCQDKMFDADDTEQEKIYEDAQNILISPNRRIAAEIRWFCGDDAKTIKFVLDNLRDGAEYSGQLVGPLSALNNCIYGLKNKSIDNIDATIYELDQLYSGLNQDSILKVLNKVRHQAGISAIPSIDLIDRELRALKDDIKSEISSITRKAQRNRYVRLANKLMESLDKNKNFGPIVIEFMSVYHLDVKQYATEYQDKIEKCIDIINDNPSDANIEALEECVYPFAMMMKPVYEMDRHNYGDGIKIVQDVFEHIRGMAADYYMERDNARTAHKVLLLLKNCFSGYTGLMDDEGIDNDLKIVAEDIHSVVFEEAISALENIFSEIDQYCYYEDGHAASNKSFYDGAFKRSLEKIMLEFANRNGYSSDEYQVLCKNIAKVYLYIGNMLTFADAFSDAVNEYQKGLRYARLSKDNELISKLKKNIDECSGSVSSIGSNSQNGVSETTTSGSGSSGESDSNSDNSGCGCLVVFITTCVGGAIGGFLGAAIGFGIGCFMMEE